MPPGHAPVMSPPSSGASVRVLADFANHSVNVGLAKIKVGRQGLTFIAGGKS
jgi:hypothetical protein